MRMTRWVGNAGWWVFVVARLVGEMGEPVAGTSRDFIGFLSAGGSWTAYTPLTDAVATSDFDTAAPNTLMTVSLVALAITVIAAGVQGVLARRFVVGIALVAAPIVGGALILWALYHRAGVADTMSLSLFSVFALVLTGVAIRGVGSRVDSFATPRSDIDGSRTHPA